jgi:hypothetical protein
MGAPGETDGVCTDQPGILSGFGQAALTEWNASHSAIGVKSPHSTLAFSSWRGAMQSGNGQ